MLMVNQLLRIFPEFQLLEEESIQKLKICKRNFDGLGISILSTSKGVLSDNEARTENVGGEILCKIF